MSATAEKWTSIGAWAPRPSGRRATRTPRWCTPYPSSHQVRCGLPLGLTRQVLPAARGLSALQAEFAHDLGDRVLRHLPALLLQIQRDPRRAVGSAGPLKEVADALGQGGTSDLTFCGLGRSAAPLARLRHPQRPAGHLVRNAVLGPLATDEGDQLLRSRLGHFRSFPYSVSR